MMKPKTPAQHTARLNLSRLQLAADRLNDAATWSGKYDDIGTAKEYRRAAMYAQQALDIVKAILEDKAV